MEDEKIVNLYLERSETAISETQKKYGRYCFTVAYNVLYSKEDAEECVNDTFEKAWNSIPPQKPRIFSAFLGAITRNLALDRYEQSHAKKRYSPAETALEELGECIPAAEDGADISDTLALKDAINGFLASLNEQTRVIFMRRYWYFCSIKEIAKSLDLTESKVKVSLMRTRNAFKEYLEQQGIII